MSDHHPSSPIRSPSPSAAAAPPSPDGGDHHHSNNNNNHKNESEAKSNHADNNNNSSNNNVVVRRERPARACTARSAARLYAAAVEEADVGVARRRPKSGGRRERRGREEAPPRSPSGSPSPPPNQQQQWSKAVTPLVSPPPPAQLPRWSLRSMWELASILNFLNVFRPLLNIQAEFTVEEFETALLTPNNTLGDIHIPLLKAIPPITRMALGRNTWVTVLCRKLRDWWHWVAEGDLPIVASHGAEVEAYKALDPGVRVVILKALCDIRVEQEDVRNYIDDSIKHGVQLSAFRKERIGGDSYGISYWYEDDAIIGHRLYRETRKVEVKKGKGKSVQPIPSSSYQWETVATNFEEFQDVSEKLFTSQNRTEASLGKKLKIDKLPEIEKEYKRRERLLKKQHRQALLLDSMMVGDELAPGRSLRGRKPVTYTFDDYDRSINEAIKITKSKRPSPEPTGRREFVVKPDASTNGRWSGGPSQVPQHVSFEMPSPNSPDFDGADEDHKPDPLDRSDRRRKRPQRYSANEFLKAVSDNETDFDSDDDIVGEAVYDEEYLRKRKEKRKVSSSSEGDEEYNWDQENAEEEDYDDEEEEEDDSASVSDDSDEPKKVKKLPGRTRREAKLRSVGNLQLGLRRSERANRNRIDYRKYEFSESETESMKPEKSNASDERSDTSNNAEFSMVSEDNSEFEANDVGQEMKIEQPIDDEHPKTVEREEIQEQQPEKSNSPSQDEVEGVRKRRFLDLNELAPGPGFEDGPTTTMKDEDTDDF